MSNYDINSNPKLVEIWLSNLKTAEQQYCQENPDSLIPFFKKELRTLGFEFETSNQIFALIPKHKEAVVPVATKYYQLAKALDKPNEQDFFLNFFHIKNLEKVIPMLIEDYYSDKTRDSTRWFISDCIYTISSKKFTNEYLDIISNDIFGRNRQMIILLLGKIKEKRAIPILIDLLDDEEVQLQALTALSNYKIEELRSCFERFLNSSRTVMRNQAKKALKRLE